MGLLGRYFSTRDIKLVNSVNAELHGDIIQTIVTIFKLSPAETNTNIYGETSIKDGKTFFSGIEMTCLINREANDAEYDDFGPTRKQTVLFRFRRENLKVVSLYPEIGDIIKFNEKYHEIDNVVEENFLGGIPEKSFDIICHAHYSRLSKLNLIER